MSRSDPAAHASQLNRSQRGSVILFVLGLILLTSFMLMRFIDRAHTELLTEARHSQQTPLRHEAYSGLQIALAVLADIAAIDDGLHSPNQGWGQPLDYFEYTPSADIDLTIEVHDETGLLSLPGADPTAITSLLVNLGLLESEAERITDAIAAWSTPDYPAQYSDSGEEAYLRHDPPISLPQRPVRTTEELRLMPAVLDLLCDENGQWNEIGQRFLANISLFSFNQTNLNTGSPDVLASFGLSDTLLRSLEDRRLDDGREPPPPFRSLGEAASQLGSLPENQNLGATAELFRIHITASNGGRAFQLVAIVRPGSNQSTTAPSADDTKEPTSEPRPWTRNSIDSPFQILEIRENETS